ncbi:MAG: S4 domain-containing protein [Alphaproteobacteria bacterium]|mgnify:CR=1 FL=1|nr:S4 domain-containing protein [Alphaproteobacteria bacterium]
MTPDGGDEPRMRVDVWLWRARFCKTRSTASHMIERSGLRIERAGQVRRIDKPSVTVAPGDLLSFASASGPAVVRVLCLPRRRESAAEAALCFQAVAHEPPDRRRQASAVS